MYHLVLDVAYCPIASLTASEGDIDGVVTRSGKVMSEAQSGARAGTSKRRHLHGESQSHSATQ